MSPRPSTWWELDVVAAKLGYGARYDNLARLVRRLITDGIISADEFSSERRESVAAHGGRPRDLFFLAPSAVVAVSAHARTPEAATFRRDALKHLVTGGAPALPAPPVVWADDTPEQLAELRAENKALTARVTALFSVVSSHTDALGELGGRVADGEQERAAIREALVSPALTLAHGQLALFGDGRPAKPKSPRPTQERDARLLASFERLLVAVRAPDGLRAKAVVEHARVGVAEAVELLRLAGVDKAPNGVARELGKALAKVAGREIGGRVLVRYVMHDHVSRWVIESGELQ